MTDLVHTWRIAGLEHSLKAGNFILFFSALEKLLRWSNAMVADGGDRPEVSFYSAVGFGTELT